jgi:hypothetical protein
MWLLIYFVESVYTAISKLNMSVQGFEARGTTLAQRSTAWKNLLDAAGSSGQLTVNPRRIKRPKYNMSQNVISSVCGIINCVT